MPDFIDLEIQRHCPNPGPRSAIMVEAMPLILFQVILLAEDDCASSTGLMRSSYSLTKLACAKLTEGGMIVGAGDLARKVCGPLLGRLAGLHFIRRASQFQHQREIILTRAEQVYLQRLSSLLSAFTLPETEHLISCLRDDKLGHVLHSLAAIRVLHLQNEGSGELKKVIDLGRALFL